MRPKVALVAVAVTIAFLAVSAGLAVSKENPKAGGAQQLLRKQAGTKRSTLPKLVLPNIPLMVSKLRHADRAILAKQFRKSGQVLAFFDRKDVRWVLAPRHEKCWEVPWQRSCTSARAVVRLHAKLHVLAEERLLYELPNTNDWNTAIHIVQRVYPNTAEWLWNCSDAEGGHGDFVVYGGGPYYPGAEYDHTWWGPMVGGWMQYMWGTFKGHYRHALDDLKSRGFHVELPAVDDVSAWLNPLAQALAAGWARSNGEDGPHWTASSSNGC